MHDNKKSAASLKDDGAERRNRGTTLIFSFVYTQASSLTHPTLKQNETHSCPLTEATVNAHRAGSRVDFASAYSCVAPARRSLQCGKRYLSRSSPFLLSSIVRIPVSMRFVNRVIYSVQTRTLLKATSVLLPLSPARTPIAPEL